MQRFGQQTGEADQIEACVSESYAQAASGAIADGNTGPPWGPAQQLQLLPGD